MKFISVDHARRFLIQSGYEFDDTKITIGPNHIILNDEQAAIDYLSSGYTFTQKTKDFL